MAAIPSPTGRSDPDASTRRIAEDLYRNHRHFLLAIATRNSADQLDAEEALQDAFLIFLDRFDPETRTPPLAWLTLTLKRHCWAIYRRKRSAPDTPQTNTLDTMPDQTASPEEAAEAAELLARHRKLIRLLRPNERRALGLLALGFSYHEIMRVTGWTYTKVNRSIRDGRAQLRQG